MQLVSEPLDIYTIGFLFNDCLAICTAGLLVTYVALNLMDGHGQPALLYIVPFTLGKMLSLDNLAVTCLCASDHSAQNYSYHEQQ